MHVQELDLRATMLRQELVAITTAPEDRSLNQVKESAIQRHFEEVAEIARLVALKEDIHAVGKSPEECIVALAASKGWGEVTSIRDLEGGDGQYTWGRRFSAGGMSMKAAGVEVPGGFMCTWWK